jgi:hypothetical protein
VSLIFNLECNLLCSSLIICLMTIGEESFNVYIITYHVVWILSYIWLNSEIPKIDDTHDSWGNYVIILLFHVTNLYKCNVLHIARMLCNYKTVNSLINAYNIRIILASLNKCHLVQKGCHILSHRISFSLTILQNAILSPIFEQYPYIVTWMHTFPLVFWWFIYQNANSS